MRRLGNIPSQDPLLDSFKEDVIESGHAEHVDNPERGCGHLEHNAAYVRSDVNALSSPDGEIPRFVELDDPIEFREYSTGGGAIIPGFEYFPGTEFSFAYENSGYTTTPAAELRAHLSRLRSDELHGDHYAEMEPAKALDLLMSVGKSHWPTPGDYIEECQEHGLNLRVPASQNREPPVINPMRTRCWVIHPHGAGEDRAGIIGYAVLTRTIFTAGTDATADDADVPGYAEDWAKTGKVSLVTPDEPEVDDDEEEEQPDAAIGDFVEEEGESIQPSDKPGRDVEAAPPGYQNAPGEMYPDDEGDGDGEDLPEFEAAHFWERYDIPIDFATAQNSRIGELQRGSTGTGATEDTATHFYVLEDFEDGRLEREAGRFLCHGEGERPDRPTEPAENPSKITCETCRNRMERWKVDDDGE